MEQTGAYYAHDGTVIDVSEQYSRSQLSGRRGIASATSDSEVYDAGYVPEYQILTDNPYGQFATSALGLPVLIPEEKRCSRTEAWTDATAAQKRTSIEDSITGQVPQYSATDIIADNALQEYADHYTDQARIKKDELDATPDEELDNFDPTLAEPVVGTQLARVSGMAGTSAEPVVAKAPPLTWALMFRGQWEAGKTYLTNTMVGHNDRAWVSSTITEEEPSDSASQWYPLDDYTEVIQEYETRIAVLESTDITPAHLKNFMIVKASQLVCEGRGTADPHVHQSYNVASVVREGVGRYLMTLTQSVFWGVPITISNTVTLIQTLMPSTLDAQTQYIDYVSQGVYRIRVYTSQDVGGDEHEPVETDLQVGDALDVIGLADFGDGTLPPVQDNT